MAENRVQHVTAQDVAADVRKTMEDTKNFARETILEGKRTASEYGAMAREKATAAKAASESYIRDNPWRSVLGALGIGMLVGLILGSRRR